MRQINGDRYEITVLSSGVPTRRKLHILAVVKISEMKRL